jgi:hypothetical protein
MLNYCLGINTDWNMHLTHHNGWAKMNKRAFLLLVLIAVFFFSNNVNFANCFTTYKSALGFQAQLPQWDKAEMMRDSYHEFICAYSKTIYIKIYTLKNTNEDILHTLTWKIWDTDPNAHFIINTKSDRGGIIVTSYRSTGVALHRIKIIQNANNIFIIECSAPEQIFYKYEIYFNKVFQTFSVI